MVNKISESELEIMKVLWQNGKMTLSEIVDCVSKHNSWSKSTIKTLVYRLVDKGILDVIKSGSVFEYSAKVSEEDYKMSENQNFLQRLYNGSISDMLVAYTKYNHLSRKDIDDLMKLIDSDNND